MSRILRKGGWCALAAALLFPPAVSAQANPEPARTLGGHTFIPSSVVDDPFITSMIRNRTGAGMASGIEREIQAEVLDSLFGPLEGDLAFIALDLEYEHAVRDWLGLSASGTVAARLGTGTESVLSEGVTSLFNLRFEALARLYQSDDWMVSANAQLFPVQQYRLSVLDFAQGVAEDGQISPGDEILQTDSGTGTSVGLRAAWGATPWLGLVLGGDLGLTDALEDDDRNRALAIQALASIDLAPVTGLPLGFHLLGKRDSFVLDNSDITNWITTLGSGLFYTGRPDFSFGVDLSYIDLDGSVTAMTTGLNLWYYF